jgi:hypothetical protein
MTQGKEEESVDDECDNALKRRKRRERGETVKNVKRKR